MDFPKVGIDLSEIPDGYVDVEAQIERAKMQQGKVAKKMLKKVRPGGKCVDTSSGYKES